MGEQQATGIQLLGHREQLQLNRENDQRKLENISSCSVANETARLHAGSVGIVAECRRHYQEKFEPSSRIRDSQPLRPVASRQNTDCDKMHTILEYRAGKLHHQQEKSPKFSASEDSAANHEDFASIPLILRAPESFNHKHHLLHNGHASVESTTVKAQHNNRVNCSATTEDVLLFNQVVNSNCMDSANGRRGVGGCGDIEKAQVASVMKPFLRQGSSKCKTTTWNKLGSGQSNMLQRQFLLNKSVGINPVTSNGAVQYNELNLTATQSKPKNENWMIEGTPSKRHVTMSIRNGNIANKSKENYLKKCHSVSTPPPSSNRHSTQNVTAVEVESITKNQGSSTLKNSVFWEESCSDDEDSGFFLQENDSDADGIGELYHSFAGFRNYMMPERAICGETGTVRGMRNRVRAGIATFLNQTTGNKNFHQLEANKVVIYTTTTGIVRGTFQQCLKVKTILSTLLVSFEERDIFKCRAYQRELIDRLDDENVCVPQVFVEGYHLGDANVIEKLNECGRLRKILRPYKRANANKPCHKCGGYLLLLCSACNGSKKSLTRNQFSDSLAPLRCTKCDECGLIPCDLCCSVQPINGNDRESINL